MSNQSKEPNKPSHFELTPDFNSLDDQPTQNDYCPQCSKLWTLSEIEYQQCDYCGYPLTEQRHKHHHH